MTDFADLHREVVRRGLLTGIPYCPHVPQPKQQEFLALTCEEALYGGAAGGGKSDALLMGALQYVRVPGYRALILRRTFKDLSLSGAIMNRAHDWFRGSGARWDYDNKRYEFSDGGHITFGFYESERDQDRYQGAELQYVGFDELTQFEEKQYLYLFSRLRPLVGLDVPMRMRSASNPGSVGHRWVKRRFIDDPEDRVFIRAKAKDNPKGLRLDDYMRMLERLDPITRRQLRDGEWIVDDGSLLWRYDDARNGISALPDFKDGWCHVLGIDIGTSTSVETTAFAVIAWHPNVFSSFCVESFTRGGQTPSDTAEEIRRLSDRYNFESIVADAGGLGGSYTSGYIGEWRKRFALPVHPAEKRKKAAFIDIINGDLMEGKVKIVRAANAALIAEMNELPWNDRRNGGAVGHPDHLSDAFLYAIRRARAFHAKEPVLAPAYGSKAYYDAVEQQIVEKIEKDYKETRDAPWWSRYPDAS